MNHVPLFLCPHDMLCNEVKTDLFIFVWNQRYASWNPYFSSFNLREKSFLEIGSPVYSQIAREIDVASSKRSFKNILIIIRSSRLVLMGGLLVLDFGSSVLATLNLPNTPWTTLFDVRTIPAISEYDLPYSRFAKMSFFTLQVKQLRAFASILLKSVPTKNDSWLYIKISNHVV